MSKQYDEQQRILSALTEVHRQRVTERARIRAEIERVYETRLYELKLQEAALFIEGHDAGISKSKLGRAAGTSDWATIQEMLELGRTMCPAPVKVVSTYHWSEKFTMPNGYAYWFLLIAGDDHVTRAEGLVEHAGYPYVDFGAMGYTWPLDKPNEDAQAWVEENKPA